jgi:hypothetical protein
VIVIVIVIEIEVETEVDREEGWDGVGGAHLGGTCTEFGYVDADR